MSKLIQGYVIVGALLHIMFMVKITCAAAMHRVHEPKDLCDFLHTSCTYQANCARVFVARIDYYLYSIKNSMTIPKIGNPLPNVK